MFLQFHERCCATSNCNDVSIRDEFTMHGGLLVAIEAGTVGRHGCKTILHRHNLDIVPSVLIQLRWTPSGAFVGSAPFGGLRYEAAWAFVVVLWLYFPLCRINWTRLRNTVRRTRNCCCLSCITKHILGNRTTCHHACGADVLFPIPTLYLSRGDCRHTCDRSPLLSVGIA